jgi:hypothetical protein
MSNKIDCGEHSSDIIRTSINSKQLATRTSVTTVLYDIKKVPNVHKVGLLDASGALASLARYLMVGRAG